MAVLNITYCQNDARMETGWPVARPIYSTSADVTIGATSVQSAVGPDNSGLVMLHAEAACRFVVGSNPTALATSTVIGAGQTLYVPISKSDRVAVIEF